MKQIIQNDTYGEIVYEENFWTGRKSLAINKEPLQKISKNVFQMKDGKQVTLSGTFFVGVKLVIGFDTIQLIPTIKWYEIVMSLLPFILIMVWGNTVTLCRIVPVVGGAIGGGISGLMSCANCYAIRNVKKLWLKILISVLMLGATFGICCGIGYALVGAYYSL